MSLDILIIRYKKLQNNKKNLFSCENVSLSSIEPTIDKLVSLKFLAFFLLHKNLF